MPRKATLQLCTTGGRCNHVHIEHLLEVEVKALLVILGLREELSGSGGGDRGETSGQRRRRGECRGGGGKHKDRENDLHCWGGSKMTNDRAQVEVRSGSESSNVWPSSGKPSNSDEHGRTFEFREFRVVSGYGWLVAGRRSHSSGRKLRGHNLVCQSSAKGRKTNIRLHYASFRPV